MRLKDQTPYQSNLSTHNINLSFIATNAYSKDVSDYLESWQVSHRREILNWNE